MVAELGGGLDEAALAVALEVWFNSRSGNRNVWRTPVGRLLKARMEARGNFKRARRGRYGPAMRARRDFLREAWSQFLSSGADQAPGSSGYSVD